MWAYVTSGSVQEIYTKPKAIKIGDNQYPQNIFGSHNGSNTVEAVNRVSEIAIGKILHFLSE